MTYEDFDKYLETEFPKMFPNGAYCGVGEGWQTLIKTLCENIQLSCDSNPDTQQVVVTQIKEKFGTLRFYYDGGDSYIHGMVTFAEDLSGTICEQCGKPGSLHGKYWVYTACDEHVSEKDR